MDGNGRWARARGLPRTAGHLAGAESVRSVVEAAPGLGIAVLTLYAFSSDNWKRPPSEVSGLLALFRSYLRSEAGPCRDRDVRVGVIGRRDRLPPALVREIERAERATRACRGLNLRIAVDYSSRDAILAAARRACDAGELSREALSRALGRDGPVADVDLLIRTGGERRLSDFLLWECAYAELAFTPTMWPDFRGADLAETVAEFGTRERRFGDLPPAVGAPVAARTAPGGRSC